MIATTTAVPPVSDRICAKTHHVQLMRSIGYDGLHPNAWGEYQIASAFSKTLVNDFNIGSQPLAAPAQVSWRMLSNDQWLC